MIESKEMNKMINFGKDVFEEGKEVGVEQRNIDLIINNLKRNRPFKDIVEFLLFSEEEIKHYTNLLQERGIIV